MKILIAYDGSECSDFAIDDLGRAGLPAQAEAVVMSVGESWDLRAAVDRSAAESGKFVHPTTRLVETYLADTAKKAKTLAEVGLERVKGIFPAWNAAAEGICGKPVTELLKKADEWSPDLLVVGSHGRSALGRLMLGSVSNRILHEAHCSVRIAKMRDSDAGGPVQVLVAVDGSPNSEEVVRIVAAREWPHDTEVRLVVVDDPFSQPTIVYLEWNLEENILVDNEESRAWVERMVGAPEEVLRSAGVRVSHSIRWGDAASGILQEANAWSPDTIFLGARGLGRVKRFLLGSVSSTVATKAPCSVEVTRML